MSDLRQPALFQPHTTRAVGAHQAAGVVAHVPQGDKREGHPGAVLRGNLVLSSHNGRDRPPVVLVSEGVLQGQFVGMRMGLDDLVEVGVLPRRVLVLAKDVVYGLCGLQVANLILLEVEGGVVLAGEGLNVGLPERVRVGPLTQQMEGQCDVSHGLKNPVLRIQGP